MVTIDFEMSHEGMVYRDALVLPDDHGMSDEQIEAIKQQRFANWVALLTPVEETE